MTRQADMAPVFSQSAGLAAKADVADYVIGDEADFADVFESDTAALFTFSIKTPVSILKKSAAVLPLFELPLTSSSPAVLYTGKGDCRAALVIQNVAPHTIDMGNVSCARAGGRGERRQQQPAYVGGVCT